MEATMTYVEGDRLKLKSEKALETIFSAHKATFTKLTNSVKIGHPNKPMTDGFEGKCDDELGLNNPYSIISCFVLYLYSIEFGRPNLYAEVNRAAREMDTRLLPTLGPFAYALW